MSRSLDCEEPLANCMRWHGLVRYACLHIELLPLQQDSLELGKMILADQQQLLLLLAIQVQRLQEAVQYHERTCV